MFKNLRKYKFDGGFLFLVLISVFGYLTYHVDKQTDGAQQKIDVQEIKAEIKEDFDQIAEKLEHLKEKLEKAETESANHNRYNQ